MVYITVMANNTTSTNLTFNESTKIDIWCLGINMQIILSNLIYMITFEVCQNHKKDENICLIEIFIKD